MIIDADGFSGQETVDAGTETDGIAIALSESACRAVDVGHDFVDDRRSESWVEAGPVGVEERAVAISAREGCPIRL